VEYLEAVKCLVAGIFERFDEGRVQFEVCPVATIRRFDSKGFPRRS